MTSARPDTRYLATNPITTDIGQRLTNLTVSGAGGYESNSSRTSISGAGAGRSIEMTVDIDNANTGALVDHTHTGTVYRIAVSAGGVVEFRDSSGIIKSITAPNVGGAANSYVVAWSTEPNPLTTGASNTLRSEFVVYDTTPGNPSPLSWDTATHATPSLSGTNTFTVGGVYTGGVLTQAYTPAIDAVRISSRFHTRVETREHFVAQTAAPSITGIAACQVVVPPSDVFADSYFAGPHYQWAAASMQTGRDRHRLVSCVWHWDNATLGTTGFSDDMRDTVGSKWVIDHGQGWQTPLCWIAKRRVPPHTSWLRVRVQWATWETAPGVTDKVELRFHTADGPPGSYTNMSYKMISRTADDTAGGAGVNQVFDFVWVQRAVNGYTYMWLSARTDDGSGSGNATYQVRSVDAMPVVLDDGYDGQVPNQWGP